jgi:ribosomal protein RSM22 (predicted rRNA methylase)
MSMLKHLPTGWKDEADAMGEAQLRAVIVESSNNLRTIDDEMAENDALQRLKTKVKDASQGYNDAKKAQKAKVAYALHCLEQAGKI